jgi:hypothetical protein
MAHSIDLDVTVDSPAGGDVHDGRFVIQTGDRSFVGVPFNYVYSINVSEEQPTITATLTLNAENGTNFTVVVKKDGVELKPAWADQTNGQPMRHTYKL